MSNNTPSDGYNGYSNRQSWTVSLWLDNDESTYSMLTEWANEEAKNQRHLADMAKEFVEEGNPLASEASLYSDLLSHALAMTDWYEVVEVYWNERESKAKDETPDEQD